MCCLTFVEQPVYGKKDPKLKIPLKKTICNEVIYTRKSPLKMPIDIVEIIVNVKTVKICDNSNGIK